MIKDEMKEILKDMLKDLEIEVDITSKEWDTDHRIITVGLTLDGELISSQTSDFWV